MSGFGCFGQPTSSHSGVTNTGLFGGRPAQTQTRSGGLFGNTNENISRGGLFGNSTTNTSATGGSLFGNASNTANGGLNQPAQAQTSSGGLFGNVNNTSNNGSLFGASNIQMSQGGGLFGRPNATGGGLFGASNDANVPRCGLFGSTPPATRNDGCSCAGLWAHGPNCVVSGNNQQNSGPVQATGCSDNIFGTPPNPGPSLFPTRPSIPTAPVPWTGERDVFGLPRSTNTKSSEQVNRTSLSNGTGSTPFQPTQEKEPVGHIAVYQTITFMDCYKHQSFEEIRLADYHQGRKFGNGITIHTTVDNSPSHISTRFVFPSSYAQNVIQPQSTTQTATASDDKIIQANIRIKELEAETLRQKLQINTLEAEVRQKDQQIKDVTAVKPFACTCKIATPSSVGPSTLATTIEAAGQGKTKTQLKDQDARMGKIEAQVAQLSQALLKFTSATEQDNLNEENKEAGIKGKAKEVIATEKHTHNASAFDALEEEEVGTASGVSTPAGIIYTPGSDSSKDDEFVDIEAEAGKKKDILSKEEMRTYLNFEEYLKSTRAKKDSQKLSRS